MPRKRLWTSLMSSSSCSTSSFTLILRNSATSRLAFRCRAFAWILIAAASRRCPSSSEDRLFSSRLLASGKVTRDVLDMSTEDVAADEDAILEEEARDRDVALEEREGEDREGEVKSSDEDLEVKRLDCARELDLDLEDRLEVLEERLQELALEDEGLELRAERAVDRRMVLFEERLELLE